MNITTQTAKQLRDVISGGNWTTSNFKENLAGLTWEQATTKVNSFNTIATLVYHTTYYIGVLLKVFKGEPLNAKDKYSFDVPPIASQEDWEN